MPWSRLWVAIIRLSRILTFAWSVSRWLISSPTRLTTPSTPSMASGGGRSVVGRQACQLTVGFLGLARSGSRVSPTTSSPRASRASQSAEPSSPDAPVTSTRIGRDANRAGALGSLRPSSGEQGDHPRRRELADQLQAGLLGLQYPLRRVRRVRLEVVGRVRRHLVENLPAALGIGARAGDGDSGDVAAAAALEGGLEAEIDQ